MKPDVARRRAYTYITRTVTGPSGPWIALAVFTHRLPGAPEAGVQVPGGTIEAHETPEAGALREAFEETGLADLELVRHLATDLWRGDGRTTWRYFYHLRVVGPVPEAWDHEVSAGQDDKGMVFRYRWVSLAEAGALIGPMGDYLGLLESCALRASSRA